MSVFLGRKKQGDSVGLAVMSVDPTGIPTKPDATPTASTYTHAGALIGSAIPLPLANSDLWLFMDRKRLGASYAVGRVLVLYEWIISGVTYSSAAHFMVVTGGGADGPVSMLRRAELPSGEHVIYVTENGKILSGRKPRK